MPKTVELCIQVRAIFPDKDDRDALIESLQKQYESGMIGIIINLIMTVVSLFAGDFSGALKYAEKALESFANFYRGIVIGLIEVGEGLLRTIASIGLSLASLGSRGGVSAKSMAVFNPPPIVVNNNNEVNVAGVPNASVSTSNEGSNIFNKPAAWEQPRYDFLGG